MQLACRRHPAGADGRWRGAMNPQEVDVRSRPEGPFESADLRYSRGVSGEELVRFLDFVDAFGSEADQVLSLRRGYDETRMLTTLLRNHLTGKLTTTSLLADSSGLGYGTAIRAIRSIEERGLLIRRPRTRTGKSFSLHPSVKLIDEWQEYARRIRGAIGGTLDVGGSGQTEIGDYYFGASYARSNTIPPPTPFATKLKLRRGLRVLAHADPTFMAINVLKRQFESLFGIRINSRALSIDRLRQEILENAERKVSRYDLVACDLPWFGELVEKGALMPIDGFIAESKTDLDDFHKAALASARYPRRPVRPAGPDHAGAVLRAPRPVRRGRHWHPLYHCRCARGGAGAARSVGRPRRHCLECLPAARRWGTASCLSWAPWVGRC